MLKLQLACGLFKQQLQFMFAVQSRGKFVRLSRQNVHLHCWWCCCCCCMSWRCATTCRRTVSCSQRRLRFLTELPRTLSWMHLGDKTATNCWQFHNYTSSYACCPWLILSSTSTSSSFLLSCMARILRRFMTIMAGRKASVLAGLQISNLHSRPAASAKEKDDVRWHESTYNSDHSLCRLRLVYEIQWIIAALHSSRMLLRSLVGSDDGILMPHATCRL